jgi:transcriptional regulator of acetoin/glycerol metabolism
MANRMSHGGTADHVDPLVPVAATRQAVFISAFPHAAVLPISNGSVGRDWLKEHGAPDREVSGHHLKFERKGSAVYLSDAGSRNGTWVNGKILPPDETVALEDGTVVRLGRSLLVYREGLIGAREPAGPVDELVGPFGLRRIATMIDALVRHPPRNILVEGETGTGKELAAMALAKALGRNVPYAPVNVAGVASGVFESQLFGHVAGAFSDAKEASRGIVLAHEGGTVFLDEIGELPIDLQPKLLRLLENREVLSVGAERPVQADVMIIAATNQKLEALVEQSRFRQDLFARLSVARLRLPPLRDRAEDLYSIARHVGPRVGAVLEPEHTEVEAMERLLLEPWPTNVRGLIAALSQIVAIDQGAGLRLWAVEEVLGKSKEIAGGPLTQTSVDAALQACDGNESRAARRLGVTRGKLRRFLSKPR